MSAPTGTIDAVRLPVGLIRPGNNDRKHFDPARLRELADSIAEVGDLIEPVMVRPVDGGWEIIAGERRYRAVAELLGWPDVLCIVRDWDDAAASVAMLAENLQRVDLRPTEEGRAYRERMDAFGLTVVEVARMAGVSWNRVDAKVCLLRLVPEAQQAVDAGTLKETWAWGMTGLDVNRQRLAFRALSDTSTHAQFRALCARLKAEQDAEPLFDADAFLQVEEYVRAAEREAKATRPQQMRRLLALMADALDGSHPELAAEARSLVGAG